MYPRLLIEGSISGPFRSTIERTSTSARPLLRIHLPGQLDGMLGDAHVVHMHVVHMHIAVGGFNADNASITDLLDHQSDIVPRHAVQDTFRRVRGLYAMGRS